MSLNTGFAQDFAGEALDAAGNVGETLVDFAEDAVEGGGAALDLVGEVKKSISMQVSEGGGVRGGVP